MATDVVAKASLFIDGKALCISVTCSLSEDIKGAGLGATQNRPYLKGGWISLLGGLLLEKRYLHFRSLYLEVLVTEVSSNKLSLW